MNIVTKYNIRDRAKIRATGIEVVIEEIYIKIRPQFGITIKYVVSDEDVWSGELWESDLI